MRAPLRSLCLQRRGREGQIWAPPYAARGLYQFSPILLLCLRVKIIFNNQQISLSKSIIVKRKCVRQYIVIKPSSLLSDISSLR